MIQRRRWINSSYFAFFYVFRNFYYNAVESKHNFIRKYVALIFNMFIALVSPFREVSANTISRWIKCFIGSAGVDTSVFSAHSTRGAAASKAATSGLSIDVILRAGGRIDF